MNKTKSLNILNLLYEIIPSPKCELDYSNNFELLCAVLLSAAGEKDLFHCGGTGVSSISGCTKAYNRIYCSC